jgi:CRP-like cAMP-binding protein
MHRRFPTEIHPAIAKLSKFVPLSDRDAESLLALVTTVHQIQEHVDISVQGDLPHAAFMLIDGVACRYCVLEDGRRQILHFLLPGDICDSDLYLLDAMDHSIATLTRVSIASIGREELSSLRAHNPRIDTALRVSALQDAAIQRERLVSLGRRSARQRVAHLLCEMVWRQVCNGLADDLTVRYPITQVEMADALGLTPVHVNRVLRDFRRDRLVRASRRLELLDMKRLQAICEVTPDYLHMKRSRPGFVRSIAGPKAEKRNLRV